MPQQQMPQQQMPMQQAPMPGQMVYPQTQMPQAMQMAPQQPGILSQLPAKPKSTSIFKSLIVPLIIIGLLSSGGYYAYQYLIQRNGEVTAKTPLENTQVNTAETTTETTAKTTTKNTAETTTKSANLRTDTPKKPIKIPRT